MATPKVSLMFFILVIISPILSLASRLPLNFQQGGTEEDDLSRGFHPIGSMDNVTYWQEELSMSQSNSRINCAGINWLLVRFRNKQHLDFVLDDPDTIDSSWTDGITFYSRSMYSPQVDSSIPIAHYANLALRIDKRSRSLVDELASRSFPSVCAKEFIPFQNNFAAPALLEDGELANEDGSSAIVPNALSYLGTYEGYAYWQDNGARNHANSRNYCETLGRGFHLATFEHKGHLDYVIDHGALDYSWTDYTGILSRDIFRWGDESLIFYDIPISIRTGNLGLHIRTTTNSHRLEANLESYNRPCICREHVAADKPLH